MNGRVEIYLGPGHHKGEEHYSETRRRISEAVLKNHVPMGACENHPQENPQIAKFLFGCDIAFYEFIGGKGGIDFRAQALVDDLNKLRGVCAKLVEMEPGSSKELGQKYLDKYLAQIRNPVSGCRMTLYPPNNNNP